MWASGDFSVVGTTLQIVGERLCEAVDLRATDRVLDVAAGNGNATLAAARHFADVTSRPTTSRSCCGGAGDRAEAEGLRRAIRDRGRGGAAVRGRAPSMWCSRPSGSCSRPITKPRRENWRGCAGPDGRIGLASWTPEGFIGQLFRVTGPARAAAGRRSAAGAVGHDGTPGDLFGGHADRSSAAARTSTSATSPRRTSSRCSAATTAPRTRRSPRSTRPDNAPTSRTCWSCSTPATRATAEGWSCRPNIWSRSSREADRSRATTGFERGPTRLRRERRLVYDRGTAQDLADGIGQQALPELPARAHPGQS